MTTCAVILAAPHLGLPWDGVGSALQSCWPAAE